MKTGVLLTKKAVCTVIGLLSIQILLANDQTVLQIRDTVVPISCEARLCISMPVKVDSSLLDSVKGIPKTIGTIHFVRPPLKRHALFSHALGPIAASQLVSMMFLFSQSKDRNNWDHNFGRELFDGAGAHLKTAWTRPPRWDDDPVITNYLQHPYAGSFYYNTVRNKGASQGQSFAIAVFGSTLFEYFTEAMFEQPSIQDLLVTPMFGSLLGEGFHQLTLKLARNGFSTTDKIIVFVTNPAYVWNHAFRLPDSYHKAAINY